MWSVGIARRAHTPFRPGAVNLRRVVSFDKGDTRSILRFSGGNHVYISSTEVIPQFVQTQILPSTLWTVKLSRLNEKGKHHYEGRVNSRSIPWVEKLTVLDEDCQLAYCFPSPKGMLFTDDLIFDQFFLLVERFTGGCVWINPTFVDFVAFGDKRDTVSVNGDSFVIKTEWSFRENMGAS